LQKGVRCNEDESEGESPFQVDFVEPTILLCSNGLGEFQNMRHGGGKRKTEKAQTLHSMKAHFPDEMGERQGTNRGEGHRELQIACFLRREFIYLA